MPTYQLYNLLRKMDYIADLQNLLHPLVFLPITIVETQYITKNRTRYFCLDYENLTIISIYSHIEVSFINKIYEESQFLKKPLPQKWICTH